MIVSEAQQLGDVRLRLPLHHLEEVGERDQIFVPRERLLILELEEHLVLSTLIQRIEDLHYDRNEDEEVSQSAQDVLACDQCYDSNDGQRHHQRLYKDGRRVDHRIENVWRIHPIH